MLPTKLVWWWGSLGVVHHARSEVGSSWRVQRLLLLLLLLLLRLLLLLQERLLLLLLLW